MLASKKVREDTCLRLYGGRKYIFAIAREKKRKKDKDGKRKRETEITGNSKSDQAPRGHSREIRTVSLYRLRRRTVLKIRKRRVSPGNRSLAAGFIVDHRKGIGDHCAWENSPRESRFKRFVEKLYVRPTRTSCIDIPVCQSDTKMSRGF